MSAEGHSRSFAFKTEAEGLIWMAW